MINFKSLKTINDNAYKIGVPGDYGVSATFNVSDLSLFNINDDSRLNSFKKRMDDAIQTTPNN
jgi:hypothetical protein